MKKFLAVFFFIYFVLFFSKGCGNVITREFQCIIGFRICIIHNMEWRYLLYGSFVNYYGRRLTLVRLTDCKINIKSFI